MTTKQRIVRIIKRNLDPQVPKFVLDGLVDEIIKTMEMND